MREARAAARIRSEHVARVIDVGTLDDGAPYIVMEYLEGAISRTRSPSAARSRVDEAVELVLQACEALAEAHSLGIVHRDLKPANLFLTQRADGTPCVKVLDFGISKVTQPGTSHAEAALTHTTTIMGSPLYMSPEQLRATRGVDLRTDIWALGVILYELLSGEAPFMGQTLPDISVKIAVEPPPPLRGETARRFGVARGRRAEVPREGSRQSLSHARRARAGVARARTAAGADCRSTACVASSARRVCRKACSPLAWRPPASR